MNQKKENLFIDTHCHLPMMVGRMPSGGLDLEGIQQVIDEANQEGVYSIITIATTVPDSKDALFVAQHCANVFATAGIHPCDCTEQWAAEFTSIKKLVAENHHKKIVALGETGLDFYHEPFFKQRQIDAFTAHIECALSFDLPVVVHIRNAVDEALKVLEPYQKELRGVAHSFLQTKDIAEILTSWGFYLGIGGPISYPKNESLRELVAVIPLDFLLLETDAPFLPPQQFRGKKNHPQYIPLIAQYIADLQKIEVSKVAQITTTNAKRLFTL